MKDVEFTFNFTLQISNTFYGLVHHKTQNSWWQKLDLEDSYLYILFHNLYYEIIKKLRKLKII